MSSITQEDTMLAIRISQAIQDYFDVNKNIGTIPSTEIFQILEKKNGFVDAKTNRPVSFKQFFRKLEVNNALDLIPQSRVEPRGKTINYVFESTPGKTIRARKLVPLVKN